MIKNISIHWKLPGQLYFSGQAQVAQKSWIMKTIQYIQYCEFRVTSVFQGNLKLLKTPECKKYIQHSEKFLGNSVFQGKRSCSKILNDKKYIQYSENFQRKLCFQGKRRLLKILNVKSIFNTVKIFRATLFFQCKRKLLKNRERWKKFQYSAHSLGGDLCNLGSCNLWSGPKSWLVIRTLIWTKPSFSVKIEQSDVGSSTAWYKISVTLSLFVFEFALGRGSVC